MWLVLAAQCTGLGATHVETDNPVPTDPSVSMEKALPEDALRQVVDDVAAGAFDLETSGISVGVLRLSDGERWMYATGAAFCAEALTAHTVMEIEFITEQMTAAMVLMAQEDGRLHVDDKVGDHLPAFAQMVQGVTLHHLMTHSSGLIDDLYLPAFASDRERAWTTSEMAQLLDGQARLFDAGTYVSYSNSNSNSNSNYLLLGMVLEAAYEAPFADVGESLLLETLELPNTGVCDAHDQTTPRARAPQRRRS